MKRKRIARWVLLTYIVVAIFHPFIANEDPTAFSLIPYSYHTIDSNASFVPPFQSNHILGTDIIGRDTLAGLLKGTEIAVKIGFFSVFLAAIFAIFLGLFTAYMKRFPLRIDGISIVLYILSLVVASYYLWVGFHHSMWPFVFVSCFLLIVNVAYHKININKKKKWILPVDGIYMRIIEAMKAVPGLILILALIGIFDRFSVNSLILILAFMMWPSMSRYVRAESLKVLSQEYIIAARAYGASGFRILYKHVLPKLFTSLSVIFAFAMSSAIIVESTLSFLGLGVPIEQVSWGSMLKEAQANFSAWWLAIFPGIALFGLILSLNILGEREA